MASPLRTRRDYGENGFEVNEFLNTPPTKLKRDVEKEKDPKKKKKMQEALNAWRKTSPPPFGFSTRRGRNTKVAKQL